MRCVRVADASGHRLAGHELVEALLGPQAVAGHLPVIGRELHPCVPDTSGHRPLTALLFSRSAAIVSVNRSGMPSPLLSGMSHYFGHAATARVRRRLAALLSLAALVRHGIELLQRDRTVLLAPKRPLALQGRPARGRRPHDRALQDTGASRVDRRVAGLLAGRRPATGLATAAGRAPQVPPQVHPAGPQRWIRPPMPTGDSGSARGTPVGADQRGQLTQRAHAIQAACQLPLARRCGRRGAAGWRSRAARGGRGRAVTDSVNAARIGGRQPSAPSRGLQRPTAPGQTRVSCCAGRGILNAVPGGMYALIFAGLAVALLIALLAPAPAYNPDTEPDIPTGLLVGACIATLLMGAFALSDHHVAAVITGAAAGLIVVPCLWLARASGLVGGRGRGRRRRLAAARLALHPARPRRPPARARPGRPHRRPGRVGRGTGRLLHAGDRRGAPAGMGHARGQPRLGHGAAGARRRAAGRRRRGGPLRGASDHRSRLGAAAGHGARVRAGRSAGRAAAPPLGIVADARRAPVGHPRAPVGRPSAQPPAPHRPAAAHPAGLPPLAGVESPECRRRARLHAIEHGGRRHGPPARSLAERDARRAARRAQGSRMILPSLPPAAKRS